MRNVSFIVLIIIFILLIGLDTRLQPHLLSCFGKIKINQKMPPSQPIPGVGKGRKTRLKQV